MDYLLRPIFVTVLLMDFRKGQATGSYHIWDSSRGPYFCFWVGSDIYDGGDSGGIGKSLDLCIHDVSDVFVEGYELYDVNC